MTWSSTLVPRNCVGALLSLLIAIVAATIVDVGIAVADGFRVETQVFVGDEEEPVSETTTLFRDGAVYDFLNKPKQTAVFRKPGGGKPGRFILLNEERRLQTDVSTEKLAGAMTKLRKWADKQNDPFLKFAANPEFKESFEHKNGQLVLAGHMESYTVETTPSEHSEALVQYREFLDWYTQLNTLLSGGPPPEPRLRLNEALARQKVIPVTVELTRPGEETLRAKHDFTWRLSRTDLARIDGVATSLAGYEKVSNEEFLRYTTPAAPEE